MEPDRLDSHRTQCYRILIQDRKVDFRLLGQGVIRFWWRDGSMTAWCVVSIYAAKIQHVHAPDNLIRSFPDTPSSA